ncbi:hypothetical protein QAD02_013562 [Eretmocerus hayati]|uniref:Uncharacterized protein n=1 Tax=Eretmocerus hayati TaxID=131215 RepID=A0ACC2P7M7_9HYME|nr:hypothetical protein QAD02_013562 [Eretmocerus hayati]
MLTVNVDNFIDEADDPRDLRKQGQRYAEARLIRRPEELPERGASPAHSSLMSSTRRPSQELEEGEIEEISADVSGDLQLQLFSNLNNTLKEFNENLSKNSSGKFNIKREYKLTKSTQFNIWFDHLTSELKSRDLLDVIDANIEPSKRYTYREMSRRKLWVRDIIINHLDEHYHRKIVEIDDPIKIIRNIRDTRRTERNVTESSVRAYLYRIKIDPREKISNFIDRFDNIVREYHSFEGLEAERKTDPRRNDTREPDTREAESTPYDPTVYASTPYRPRRGNEDRCNRCNLDGHHARQCPLIALGQWFCYVCRRNATHIGAECPLKHRVDNKSVYPKSSNSIPHSRGKPHKSRRAKKSTELEASYPMEIHYEDRDEINLSKGVQEEPTGTNPQNSKKRKLAEKPQTTHNKQPRLNPEKKAKTNRPTWGHLRRTQADESVEEPGLTAPCDSPSCLRPKRSLADAQKEKDDFSYALIAEINNDPSPVIATPVRLKMMRILHPGVYSPAPNIYLDLSRSVRSQTPARWSMPTASTQTEQHAIESQLQSPQDRVERDENVNKAGIVVRSVEYVPTPIKVLRKRAAEDPLNRLFEHMMI